MIKLDNSKNSFYFCECADWSTVVESQDANSAAKNAVKNMLEEFDGNVSFCMRVKKINEKFEDSDNLIRMDKILADLGMHKESKSLSEIMKNI